MRNASIELASDCHRQPRKYTCYLPLTHTEEGERHTERNSETERDRQRDRDSQRAEKPRGREEERKREREPERVRNKCRDRDKAGVTERYRNRETDKRDRQRGDSE